MKAILIEPGNKDQQIQIEKLLKELGVKNSSVSLSEKQLKYFASLKMIEIANRHPKFDVTDEEIKKLGKEIEKEVYARYKYKNNS